MGEALFANRMFRIDPKEVSWSFTIKASDKPTVGGKVIQIFGVKMSDMVVTGEFGVAGWKQQEKFLAEMKAIADEQRDRSGQSQSVFDPHRFIYPARGWDFMVYLKGYSNPDGGRSVTHSNTIINPKWRLNFVVVQDNSGITKTYGDIYLARLSKGIGWKQTGFNGPLGMAEFNATLEGRSIEEFLFGVGNVPTGNQ